MQQLKKWRRPEIVAILVLIVHAVLLGWISVVSSPNPDELAHLPAGLSIWQLGRFELYRVNPPLVRMLAALPVLTTDARTDWSTAYVDSPYDRSEFGVGPQFVVANGTRSFWYFTLARWALIPVCLVGGWVSYCWARDMYGWQAGMVAVILYCFCPNLLTWGASITPDAVAASLGLLAGYAYWRWLKSPSWSSAALAGITLGLTELTKTTWIILFALWPVLWLIWRFHDWRRRTEDSLFPMTSTCAGAAKLGEKAWPEIPREAAFASLSGELGKVSSGTRAAAPPGRQRPPALQIAAIVFLGFYIINLGYGFEESFKPLGEYRFISRSLSGQERPPGGGNRFANSPIGWLPVPLPENYVCGIDVQKFDFEQKKWSYLRGEQRKGGWCYYYLYCGLVKTPVGTLTLSGLALIVGLAIRPPGSSWLDDIVILAPALAVFVLVSSQTGFNRYFRYALPALPFIYVAASRVAVVFARRQRFAAAAIALSLAASVLESLSVVPHSLSFFNCAAGGPLGGPAHLVDANVDWGQDLLFLKKWYDVHPEARPFHLTYFGSFCIDPRIAGIEWEPVPKGDAGKSPHQPSDSTGDNLQPGWYALSVNYLRGYRYFDSDEQVYTHFQGLKPVARAGYSIYIYHVSYKPAAGIHREHRGESEAINQQ